MGSPAQPVFKSAGSEKPAGPKQEKAKLMFQTWPFVQPAIAFGITAASTYITAVSALAAVALYGGALQVRPISCPHALTPTISSPSAMLALWSKLVLDLQTQVLKATRHRIVRRVSHAQRCNA